MKIIFIANSDWYLFNFRRTLAVNLKDLGWEVLLCSPEGSYVDKLRDLGFRWTSIPLSRSGTNPLKEIFSIYSIFKILQKESPDIVHNFTIKGVIYGSIASWFSGHSKRVNSIDGLGYLFSVNDLKTFIFRPLVVLLMQVVLSSKSAKLILQNSDDVKFFERKILAGSSNITLILGAGVDCKKFCAYRSRMVGEPLRILFSARLLWGKGLGDFIEVARYFKSENRNVIFIIAGAPDPGNPDSVDIKLLNEWVEEGIVEWLGHVDDMPKLLSNVHVVTLPTTYREGLPTALTEAAACGLPLIATNVPGCRDVIKDGIDGILIPPGDIRAFKKAIDSIDINPALGMQLGLEAQMKAISTFNVEVINNKTISVYLSLLR